MLRRLRTLSAALALALAASTTLACSEPGQARTERWTTTENTNVEIDWDKINEAYKQAEGPQDFEKRVNEIYAGDEVVSVAVRDLDERVQEVTGFFDKNGSGQVDEGEKIFTIKREVTGEGTAQVQTTGYGMYGGYASPMMSIASGMLMGAMLSSVFSPRYVPVYTQPYTTSPTRRSEIGQQRSLSRAQSPSRATPTNSKASGSGRRYNSAPRSGGGGRFGIRAASRKAPPVSLTA